MVVASKWWRASNAYNCASETLARPVTILAKRISVANIQIHQIHVFDLELSLTYKLMSCISPTSAFVPKLVVLNLS
jgi:hypothetical protein